MPIIIEFPTCKWCGTGDCHQCPVCEEWTCYECTVIETRATCKHERNEWEANDWKSQSEKQSE